MRGSNFFSFPCKDFPQILTSPEVGFVKPNSIFMVVVELVDYIKVYENGNISVKFKFADELRKIAEYIEINTTEDTAVAG